MRKGSGLDSEECARGGPQAPACCLRNSETQVPSLAENPSTALSPNWSFQFCESISPNFNVPAPGISVQRHLFICIEVWKLNIRIKSIT